MKSYQVTVNTSSDLGSSEILVDKVISINTTSTANTLDSNVNLKEVTLPKSPEREVPFTHVHGVDSCFLEIRPGKYGRDEVKLTIRAGSTIVEAFDEINEQSKKLYGREAIYRGDLYKDAGVNDRLDKNIELVFTPVVDNSTDKTKKQHENQLAKLEMDFVDIPHLALAAGLYRLAHGFESGVQIGSKQDKGDLFQGLVVRAVSGAVCSSHHGGVDALGYPDGRSSAVLAVAGCSSPN
jgi:hypothetical protein